jgi:glutamyl-tRNA synthetase
MAGTLIVSPKLTPFPYAAVAIAKYTNAVDVEYDDAATAISLKLDGSDLNTEDDVVKALAKHGGLPDGGAKVRSNVLRRMHVLICRP